MDSLTHPSTWAEFPTLHDHSDGRVRGARKVRFDRVLCDVPCSGQGASCYDNLGMEWYGSSSTIRDRYWYPLLYLDLPLLFLLSSHLRKHHMPDMSLTSHQAMDDCVGVPVLGHRGTLVTCFKCTTHLA